MRLRVRFRTSSFRAPARPDSLNGPIAASVVPPITPLKHPRLASHGPSFPDIRRDL